MAWVVNQRRYRPSPALTSGLSVTSASSSQMKSPCSAGQYATMVATIRTRARASVERRSIDAIVKNSRACSSIEPPALVDEDAHDQRDGNEPDPAPAQSIGELRRTRQRDDDADQGRAEQPAVPQDGGPGGLE